MTVLIVDDQINVVEGMLLGINWERVSVARVLTANDAAEARYIIESEPVDILLCDIEMPGENGLSLFEWARNYNPKLECIFLTAYADFTYAREAVKLGGFDYILQPAKYDEVESAILRAKTKIGIISDWERFANYGKMYLSQKDRLLRAILKDYLADNAAVPEDVFTSLSEMRIPISPQTDLYVILMQVIALHESGSAFGGDMLERTLKDIFESCVQTMNRKTLFVPIDAQVYCGLVYSIPDPNANDIDDIQLREDLWTLTQLSERNLHAAIACYGAQAAPALEAPRIMRQLSQMKLDNVARTPGVHWHDAPTERLAGIMPNPARMNVWQSMLAGGEARRAESEICAFLEDTPLNLQALKLFYQNFMQCLSGACKECGLTVAQVFSDREAFDKSLVSYQSVDAMKEMTRHVVEFFEVNTKREEARYVEIAVQYIQQNIDKDIRRSDVADKVHLNEDYLSRLFRGEMGMSLKSFIIAEKMKAAQSLLRNTKFSISTIATKVGFSNFSHFTQIYKKTMGVLPTDDR